jgi:hypothetical protein
MPVFRVMISGKKVVLDTEQGGMPCGFVKNEYVWAASAETAALKAKERVQEKIDAKPGVRQLNDSPLQLVVDEIERGAPIWKLTSNESFVFFDLEADAAKKR